MAAAALAWAAFRSSSACRNSSHTRLLVSNWRLTLIQVLPAMWIWVALLNLKAHVFKGKEFHDFHGPVVIALIAAIALLTVASFYLNAVFAFAISQLGKPRIRPAFSLATRDADKAAAKADLGGSSP